MTEHRRPTLAYLDSINDALRELVTFPILERDALPSQVEMVQLLQEWRMRIIAGDNWRQDLAAMHERAQLPPRCMPMSTGSACLAAQGRHMARIAGPDWRDRLTAWVRTAQELKPATAH